MQYFYFKAAHVGADETRTDDQPRFVVDARIGVDDDGLIASIDEGISPPEGERQYGYALPGMANCHSHAFQRAMVGQAEYREAGESDFWSWRNAMYHLASRMTAEHQQAIAAQLYVEMLKAGYTSVGEFHYLHNSHRGEALAMSKAILGAGESVGLPVSLLPVLYQSADFGGAPANDGQKPFLHDMASFDRLLQILKPQIGEHDRLGMAIHSLRAVPGELIAKAADLTDGPVHIHIAEQVKEVEACIDHTGKRPVEWLLNQGIIDKRWCLIHATHMTEEEVQGVAKSGAVAGICPTTEANLGDGFFAARDFMAAGGSIAIGSDSHVSVDPREELRLLEYGERLNRRERTVLALESGHAGEILWLSAAKGGAQANGQPAGEISVGKRCDLTVLDLDAPQFIGPSYGQLLDAYIFAGQPNPASHVMVAGQWLILDGHHSKEDEVLDSYRNTMEYLMRDVQS